MNYADSRFFFEISNGPQLANTWEARWLCLKDFFKRCLTFPGAILLKVYRTFFRGICLGLAVLFILITVGSSVVARVFFVERVSILAKDLADWILLPFAIVSWVSRLI